MRSQGQKEQGCPQCCPHRVTDPHPWPYLAGSFAHCDSLNKCPETALPGQDSQGPEQGLDEVPESETMKTKLLLSWVIYKANWTNKPFLPRTVKAMNP